MGTDGESMPLWFVLVVMAIVPAMIVLTGLVLVWVDQWFDARDARREEAPDAQR